MLWDLRNCEKFARVGDWTLKKKTGVDGPNWLVLVCFKWNTMVSSEKRDKSEMQA